ncbi:MAG: galactokinase family protein [Ilumatobacteraceae bacterium]
MAFPTTAARALQRHRALWGDPDFAARAPGRVNLIGEHTDYNDGFTFPMGLPFDTVVSFESVGDPSTGAVTIDSAGFGSIEIVPGGDVPGWAKHLAGVIDLMEDVGIAARGWRACIDTDIPTGASLSSSAALEVATIRALLERVGVDWAPIDVARMGQRVENQVVGLQSGIMDQFISAGAVEGHANLMDCRALTLTPTRIPDDVVVAVMDTKTRRVLAEAAYDDRRSACERAAAAMGVAALLARRSTTSSVTDETDETDRRRAPHHHRERTRRRRHGAPPRRRCPAVGARMNESHVSLRDDFECRVRDSMRSSRSLVRRRDASVRMTGGGFAGCAVALVRADDAETFAADVVDRYDYDGLTAEVWICEPSAGASISPAT